MSDRTRDRRSDRSRSRDRDRDSSRRDRDGYGRSGRGEDRGRDRDRDRAGDYRPSGRDRYERDGGRDRDRERPRSRSRSPDVRRRSDIKEQREQKILSGISGKTQVSATESRLAMIKNLTGNGDEIEEGAIIIGADGKEENVHISGGTSEEDVMAMMGFSGFGSTKGTQVECNKSSSAVGTVSKHKKRVYRQYMNRRGGFNRPLQKMN